jgi:hypothetical protein
MRADFCRVVYRPFLGWDKVRRVMLQRVRQSKPWLTMVDTRVEVSGFVRPRRLG